MQTATELLVCSFNENYEIEITAKIKIGPDLKTVLIANTTLVLVHKHLLTFYDMPTLLFVNQVEFKSEIFDFLKLQEDHGVTTHLLCLNDQETSTHLFMNNLAVVSKIDLSSRVINVLQNESEFIKKIDFLVL